LGHKHTFKKGAKIIFLDISGGPHLPFFHEITGTPVDQNFEDRIRA
jgi:hypothetical protein